MRRMLAVAALALAAAALLLGGQALLDAGWGPALRSAADRVLPYPDVAMWALSPGAEEPDDSYADATGAGTNYVYLVDAADADGSVRELQLIFFGERPDAGGWLEIEARGGSGVRYAACGEDDVPDRVREALVE